MIVLTTDCMYSPPPILSLEEQDIRSWCFVGAKSRKEVCCHAIQEGPHLTQDRCLAFLRDFLCAYTGEGLFLSTLSLLWGNNPCPCEGIGAKKIYKSSYSKFLRENMTKTAGFFVAVNLWNILLQSGLKCRMNLFILCLLFNLKKYGKKPWMSNTECQLFTKEIENKLKLYSLFGSPPWNSLEVCETTFTLWTCTLKPMTWFYFLMTNCSELKARQVSESQKSYSRVRILKPRNQNRF